MGTTIVDALVVTLGFDTRGLKSGRSEVETETKRTKESLVKGGKEIEASTKGAAEMVTKLRKEVMSLLAVFTAGVGIQQFVKDLMAGDAATGRIATQIGMATDELSAWQGVLRRNGGTSADAVNALTGITDAYQKFITTGNAGIPFLSSLTAGGVRFLDLKDPAKGFLEIADAMSKMDPTKAAMIGRSLGWSPETIALASKGSAAIRAQLEEQKKIGGASKASAQAAQDLQDAFSTLVQKSTDLGRTLFVWLTPALKSISGWLEKLGAWAANNEPAVRGAFIGLAGAAIALSVALAAPAAPFIALALAAATISAAFAKVLDKSPELQDAIKQLGDDLGELAQAFGLVSTSEGDATGSTALKTAKIFFLTLTDLADGLANSLIVVADVLSGRWSEAWEAAKRVGHDFKDPRLAAIADGNDRGQHGASGSWNGPPGATTPPAAPAAPAAYSGAQKGVAARATAYFQSVGYSPEQAAGIAAGIMAESQGNPNVVNPKSGAFGLGQWLGPRKAKLFQQYGSQPTEGQQLQFMASELSGQGAERQSGFAIRNQKTARGTLQVYVTSFMRPNAANGEVSGDLSRGSNFLAANQNGAPSLPPSVSGLAATTRGGATVVNKTDIHIDKIEVNTRATDAKSIAHDIGPALRQRTYVTQANRGLS